MTIELEIGDFLEQAEMTTVIDVRSPSEFAQGHIPNADNVPLFDDDQRARVGSCYQNQGRDAAVLMGLEIVGPKMRRLVEQVRALTSRSYQTPHEFADQLPAPSLAQRANVAVNNHHQTAGEVLVHCWRGGMRSSSVAWLLEQTGMKPSVLRGGYKAFRRAARDSFASDRCMIVLSGMTGAGKTELLHELQEAGEQILDLEGYANHRGSSFGAIGLPPQPTCQQFENLICTRLRELDPERPLWVEDESPSIGKVRVPDELWSSMRRSPAIFLDVSRRERAAYLAKQYGALNQDDLAAAVLRLEQRLGGLRTRQAIEILKAGDFEAVAMTLLEYYDKTYEHAATRRPRDHVYRITAPISAARLRDFAQKLPANERASLGSCPKIV